MNRQFKRSQVLFTVTVVGTLVAAFLPARYLGWTRELSAIVRFPFTPMGQAGNAMAAWLRPAEPLKNSYDENDVDSLVAEKEHLRALLLAEQRRSADLTKQLDEIQDVGLEYSNVRVRPVLAKVTGRNSDSLVGPVELNRGSRGAEVTVDTVAVFNRVHLIGRITSVESVKSTLIPITHENAGLITGAIMPHDRDDVRIDQAPKIQLKPVGDGTFVGDIAKTYVIAAGDEVRMVDSTWPETAQAMLIGVVEAIEPKPQMPLRNIVTVRPHYQVYELFRVTLKIEDEDAIDENGRLTDAARAGGDN